MADISEEVAKRVRAIIIADGKILLIDRVKSTESYWVIPGGRVEAGETNEEALQRECVEELGIEVRVNDLFLERISDKPETVGHREYFYLCDMIGGEVGTGQGPEFQPERVAYEGEYNIQWVDLNKVSTLNLKPGEVKNKIVQLYNQ